MYRTERKRSVASTFRLDEALIERLNRYSARTGVSKTFAVEAALERYLEECDRDGDIDDKEDSDGIQG